MSSFQRYPMFGASRSLYRIRHSLHCDSIFEIRMPHSVSELPPYAGHVQTLLPDLHLRIFTTANLEPSALFCRPTPSCDLVHRTNSVQRSCIAFAIHLPGS